MSGTAMAAKPCSDKTAGFLSPGTILALFLATAAAKHHGLSSGVFAMGAWFNWQQLPGAA